MPAKPDFSQHVPDPRFDAYRDRAARLYRDGVEVGLAYVRVEAWAEVVGGHWWWKRWWRSVDVPHIFFVVDGDYSDTLGPPDANDEWLAEWSRDSFDYYGESLQPQWLSAAESERLRDAAFGVEASRN